ncbi:MAG TPA: hypothetical protein VFJ75_02150 [Gaiellaceae bacterium]|nr:hypothetical protein [Gaiellaceae bacterium]
MLHAPHANLESFEAIKQDDMTRDLVLRMSALSQAGKLGPFLFELARDDDLDDTTKGRLAELAHDESFLLAVEDYLHRTEIAH